MLTTIWSQRKLKMSFSTISPTHNRASKKWLLFSPSSTHKPIPLSSYDLLKRIVGGRWKMIWELQLSHMMGQREMLLLQRVFRLRVSCYSKYLIVCLILQLKLQKMIGVGPGKIDAYFLFVLKECFDGLVFYSMF